MSGAKYEIPSWPVIEVGNQFAKDPHNEALLKNGPNRLLALTYGYDVTRKAFTR